jgi:hypothetical protein
VLDDTIGGGLTTCPQCLSSFPYRKGKTYCRPTCRVYASRPKQNSEFSITKKRQNALFFDKARRIGNMLYDLPPFERLGFMKDMIDEARAGNTQLRELLSNYKLRHPHPVDEAWMFPRGNREYCTLAQAADRYCWRFWGTHVTDVVYCRCEEPDDGRNFE